MSLRIDKLAHFCRKESVVFFGAYLNILMSYVDFVFISRDFGGILERGDFFWGVGGCPGGILA